MRLTRDLPVPLPGPVLHIKIGPIDLVQVVDLRRLHQQERRAVGIPLQLRRIGVLLLNVPVRRHDAVLDVQELLHLIGNQDIDVELCCRLVLGPFDNTRVANAGQAALVLHFGMHHADFYAPVAQTNGPTGVGDRGIDVTRFVQLCDLLTCAPE